MARRPGALTKRWPPTAYLRRTRRRRRGIAIASAVGLLLLILLDQRGWLGYRGTDLQRYDGASARVVGVVDGDTLDLDLPDGEASTTRVRIWGIDTPELAQPDRPAQPGAIQAAAVARQRAYGDTVRLRLQPHRVRDHYGRLLAYVELSIGVSLGELLLAEGWARADPRWPHDELERYAQLEATARQRGQGLWSADETDDE